MTTDHYAEADSSLEQSFLTGEREDATLFALQAIAGATLALTDAVRALKAGATVTTTQIDLSDPDLVTALRRSALDEYNRRCRAMQSEEAPRG